MGMTASQARFLCLTARKSNVEFEGQQINQQRTALSNQSASYYSELCNMVVPVPPSVEDYTRVTYTFDDGALSNTITAMIARTEKDMLGYYSVNYIQQWQDDYAIVPASSSLIEMSPKADSTAENPKYDYKIGNTKLRLLGDFATKDANGNWTYDQTIVQNDPYLKSLEPEQLQQLVESELYYQKLLNEDRNNNTNAQWYVKYTQNSTTGAYVPSFYKQTEVEEKGKYVDNFSSGKINCFTVGSTTKTQEVLNQLARVEKDSSGRYVALTIYPDKDPTSGNFQSYKLITNTSTDEDAYNDAMNQYSYNQSMYDKKIQDINSKLEIVQQQDKALELNLKSLDTEENAINTELESVKKVIQKNIDSSFKTFNA